jgi:hypothetical protein
VKRFISFLTSRENRALALDKEIKALAVVVHFAVPSDYPERITSVEPGGVQPEMGEPAGGL